MKNDRVIAPRFARQTTLQKRGVGRGRDPGDELRVDEVFRVIGTRKVHDTTQGKLRHAGRRFAKLGMLAHGLGERLLRALRLYVGRDEHVSSQNDSLGLSFGNSKARWVM